MNKIEDVNSGYLGPEEAEVSFSNSFTEIEIIRTTDFNLLVRARRHGRMWLLKGLSESLRNSTSERRRLMKEFEIHSRLNHPGVARVMTCEDVEGLGPCIVMEWIEGETLQDYVLMRRPSFQERRRILEDIVDAVSYMHGMGVVHRDLKPTNIMIRKAGEAPVLIDFGLADTDDYIELKQSAGTTGYISPEQASNGGAHTSDDIYSLGVIIRLLCPEYSRIASRCQKPSGERPKDGMTLKKLLQNRLKRPRKIMISLLVVVISGIIVGGGYAVSQSRRQASEAFKTSASLKSINDESREKVAHLKDSIQVITSRMVSLEEEKKQQEEYSSKVERAHIEGKAKIRAFYKDFESKVIKKLKPGDILIYSQKLGSFYHDISEMIDTYTKGLSTIGITPLDCERINTDLKNYYYEINSNYTSEWIQRVNNSDTMVPAGY